MSKKSDKRTITAALMAVLLANLAVSVSAAPIDIEIQGGQVSAETSAQAPVQESNSKVQNEVSYEIVIDAPSTPPMKKQETSNVLSKPTVTKPEKKPETNSEVTETHSEVTENKTEVAGVLYNREVTVLEGLLLPILKSNILDFSSDKLYTTDWCDN